MLPALIYYSQDSPKEHLLHVRRYGYGWHQKPHRRRSLPSPYTPVLISSMIWSMMLFVGFIRYNRFNLYLRQQVAAEVHAVVYLLMSLLATVTHYIGNHKPVGAVAVKYITFKSSSRSGLMTISSYFMIVIPLPFRLTSFL